MEELEHFESFAIRLNPEHDNLAFLDTDTWKASDKPDEEGFYYIWQQAEVTAEELEEMAQELERRFGEVEVHLETPMSVESPLPEGSVLETLLEEIEKIGGGSNDPEEMRKTAEDRDWHLKLMNVPEAWDMLRAKNKGLGSSIIVAHPDSGYMRHPELRGENDTGVQLENAFDFVDHDNNVVFDEAFHGLATASVLLGSMEGKLKGVAPEAILIPLRVAREDKALPAPVLLWGGVLRLQNAIMKAYTVGADILSISLGTQLLRSSLIEKALLQARNHGIIVIAAAGNVVPSVVYPASSPHVIAVGGCTINKTKWKYSSKGPEVDFSAPATYIWKADRDAPGGILRSHGTSYAAANTAGIAALWLEYWGKDYLLDLFGGYGLGEAFRELVKSTCSDATEMDSNKFGMGIIDAAALLRKSPEEYRASKEYKEPLVTE